MTKADLNSYQVVEEVPGLYGGIRLEERIIQKIWNDEAILNSNLQTECGKKIIIDSPGKWNLDKEGPDFSNAKIFIDGRWAIGDVEIHFKKKHWKNHGHFSDPNYRRVILHVFLFPVAGEDFQIENLDGIKIPNLFMLPYLLKGIEEYAEEYAVSNLVGENLLSLSEKPKNIKKSILGYAQSRWKQKLLFARKRLHEGNWIDSCHQWFLEVMGYPRNRVPMHRLALRYPLQDWQKGFDLHSTYEEEKGWRLRGMRPASQPLVRLMQYAELVKKRPEWPMELLDMELLCSHLIGGEELFPKHIISHHRKSWIYEVLGGVFTGTRVDTVFIDACLPLWAAKMKKDTFALWYSWPAGDFPKKFHEIAKAWNLSIRGKSVENGIMQALMMHFLVDRGR